MTTKTQNRIAISVDQLDLSGMPWDVERIRQILPHRYPFLMLDRIVEFDRENMRLIGFKNVTNNEPFFNGHFPTASIMPGVLQVEAMAQLGAILALISPEGIGKMCVLAGVNNARFRNPVVPGDQLQVSVDVLAWKKRFGRVQGACKVDGKVVSEAEILFTVADTVL